MKNIPYSLQQKLKETVWAGEAQPDIQIIATQTSINTLITEIIHKNIPENFGDIAVRQLEGERHPSLAYALCIDNGIAEFWQRKMPANYDYPWIKDWTFGEAKEVAIEFNGEWILDSKKKWYYLKTERYPYIFWVDHGHQLFVQYWNDASSKILLDSDVVQISACRGWNSDETLILDQGMVIGYIKTDSKVYYRAWCYQSDDLKVWEISREVAELETGNTYLQVFRTNDFRLGFATENKGEMIYCLTKRNYAGQSVRPEAVIAQVCDSALVVTPIKRFDIKPSSENTSGVIADLDTVLLYYPTGTDLSFEIRELKRIGDKQLEITAKHPFLLNYPVKAYLSLSSPYLISSIEITDGKLLITATTKIKMMGEVDVIIRNTPGLKYKILTNCCPEVPNMTITFPAEGLKLNESLSAEFLMPTLAVIDVHYSDLFYVEDSVVSANNFQSDFVVMQVGEFPV